MYNEQLASKLRDLINLSNKKDTKTRKLKDASFNNYLNEAFDNIFTNNGLKKVNDCSYSTDKKTDEYEERINLDVELNKEIKDLDDEVFLKIQISINVGETEKKVTVWITSENNEYFIQNKDQKEKIDLNTLTEKLEEKIESQL